MTLRLRGISLKIIEIFRLHPILLRVSGAARLARRRARLEQQKQRCGNLKVLSSQAAQSGSVPRCAVLCRDREWKAFEPAAHALSVVYYFFCLEL